MNSHVRTTALVGTETHACPLVTKLNAIGNNTTGETSHDAVALLDTVELSLAGRATSSWDTNFTESVIRVLQTHTVCVDGGRV